LRLYPPLNHDDPGEEIASSSRKTTTIVSPGNLLLEHFERIISLKAINRIFQMNHTPVMEFQQRRSIN
jgi:hypothetical protein